MWNLIQAKGGPEPKVMAATTPGGAGAPSRRTPNHGSPDGDIAPLSLLSCLPRPRWPGPDPAGSDHRQLCSVSKSHALQGVFQKQTLPGCFLLPQVPGIPHPLSACPFLQAGVFDLDFQRRSCCCLYPQQPQADEVVEPRDPPWGPAITAMGAVTSGAMESQ